jgi:hypothetical protein
MTNAHAAQLHRRMDMAQAEALARDGGELVEQHGALMRPGDRRRDMRTMDRPSQTKVLLMQLTQRTSGRGNAYLTGWLGKAKLVGFKGEPDEHGNERWDVYAAEPEQRQGNGSRQARARDDGQTSRDAT